MRRLDYLESLGVDVLWLAPFQPSPNRDNGYDVADFYGVDPRYGSSGDFVEFVHRARSNGIRVIVDLVVNHTSDRHRWFREAREGPGSPRFDWYVWSKKRPDDLAQGHRLPGPPAGHVDARSRGEAVVLPPLLRLPARPQHAEPGRPRGDPADHGLLAGARRLRLPRRRGAVHHRGAADGDGAAGAPLRVPRGAPRLPPVARRRRRPPRRGERAAEGGAGLLPRRRRHPPDVQLLGQPAPLVRARERRRAAARRRRCATRRSCRRAASGRTSSATTTSSTSAA